MASRPLSYPAPIDKAYNGAVSNVRSTLNEWQSKITRSPGFKNELMAQLTAFITANA